MPGREPMYHSDYDKKNHLFEARYIDSMYDLKLFLRKDGRKRGLWIFLEEEVWARNESDNHRFDEGMKEFLPEVKKLLAKKNQKMLEFEMRQLLRRHFETFFGHRTEGTAFRFTWQQLRNFLKKAAAAEKAEKRKTEDYEHEED